MASADGQVTKDKKQTLICALCLEVFRKPKLLPCFHTFCESCLEKLATGPQARRFPCPSCRKQTNLPPSGIAGFQNNFYIDPDDLEKARYGLFCTLHHSRELELFCRDCDQPVCLKCKITDHEAHSTSDLHATAVPTIKEKLAVEDKRGVLKQAILNREAILKTAVENVREEALASLDKSTEEIAETLKPSWVKTVCRPVLHFNTINDDTMQRVRDMFVSSAVKMEMAVSVPEVTVVEQFRCQGDPSSDIYLLCPLINDNVVIARAPCMSQNSTSSTDTCEEFDKNGESLDTRNCEGPGKIALARTADGTYMYIDLSIDTVDTYAKKCESDMIIFFRLENDLSGQATVAEIHIIPQDQFSTERTDIFTIHCSAHRSFDVDASEQLFVVLEEGKTPDLHRKVQLYRRSQPDAIATYIPPVSPCQPSDVCFYTLGGQEVLLVADELNDAIHVVYLQDGRLIFARCLSPGCPLLVQPTALNTDMRGRLWVACRGGRILTCTPINALTKN